MTELETQTNDRTQPLDAEHSLGELFLKLSTDFSRLVSTQLELAKVELKEEVTHAGKGAGMLAGGGLAGYLALVLLSFAAAWGLATEMPTGVAFLIVGVVWLVIAAVLAAMGRTELKAVHPVPPHSKEALKEDIAWARQQKN
jgi:uncharacterized membrane protein YqjE